jgi:hypothetical protein
VGGWRWLAQAVGRIVGVHVLEASQLLLLLGGGRGRRQRPQLHLLIPSRLLRVWWHADTLFIYFYIYRADIQYLYIYYS